MVSSIRKRDGSKQEFNPEKVTKAVYAAMKAAKDGTKADAEALTKKIVRDLEQEAKSKKNFVPTVEHIQDRVELSLMSSDHLKAAKAFILYREEHRLARQKDVFKKRVNLKPFEYPELYEYVSAIRHSYWLHTEFNYTSDIQDFKVNATPYERQVLKNTMLAIAQIEVAVKTFWGDIFKKLPKPEIGAVGYTFAESEVRHHDAYSHLLEILGLNEDFEQVIETPVLQKRIEYLSLALENARSDINQDYMRSILLFSLFIEHISLFSQFLIIMSFNKYRNMFKGISNAVEATSKEEQIHGLFGAEVINLIKKEHPDWFDDELQQEIIQSSQAAYEAEDEIIDWIYGDGDLDFLPKDVVKEFVKNRFNISLVRIGLKPIFDVNAKKVAQSEWFDDEIMATKHGDFFYKRSVNYNKRSQSITSEDLF